MALAVPYLALAGGHMVGHLFLDGDPTSDLMAVTLQYLNTTVGHYVMLLGDTMTGPLILSGPPTSGNGNEAVTKDYVDAVTASLGDYLLLSGGTLSGTVHSNSPFTIDWSSAYVGNSFGFWDTANNYGFGMFALSDTQLAFGQTDVNGVYTDYWVLFSSAGDITPAGGGTIRFTTVNSTTAAILGGIEMYPGWGGFGVSSGALNYNWTGAHNFLQGSTPIMQIGSGALNMQAPLYLDRDPTANLQAATKHYVDTSVAGYLLLTGGNLTGPLTINCDRLQLSESGVG